MGSYFFETLYSQGLSAGLVLAMTAGGVGLMFMLGFQTWNAIIGK